MHALWSAVFYRFFLIPDPLLLEAVYFAVEVQLCCPMDQGSVQSGILKISLQILSPATVPDAVTSDLIPDPLESASIFHRTSPIASGSGISSGP